jgi:hypothetical protein
VAPEALQHDGLEVRHARQVGRLDGAVPGGADGGVDLEAELSLRFGVLDEVGHGPLQRRGRGLGAGAEELRDEADKLAIGDCPVTIFVDT